MLCRCADDGVCADEASLAGELADEVVEECGVAGAAGGDAAQADT